MTTNLIHSAQFIIQRFSRNGEDMDSCKLQKLLFVCDWESVVKCGRVITGTEWRKIDLGPTSEELQVCAKDPLEKRLCWIPPKDSSRGVYGRISIGERVNNFQLSDSEIHILGAVGKYLTSRSWPEMVRIVYNTYPLVASELGETLNLEKYAQVYKFLYRDRPVKEIENGPTNAQPNT